MNTAELGNNQVYEGGPKEGPKCRLRFKGIENFLRRVAFNLGNTPSQTEVKIISCIPIDVTDLQYKILTLEKELEECQHRLLLEADATAVVGTALVAPPGFPPHPASPHSRAVLPPPDKHSHTSPLPSNSLNSIHSLLPAFVSHDSHYAGSLTSSRDILTESSMLIPLNDSIKCEASNSIKDNQESMEKIRKSAENDRLHSILKKMKKMKKKRECNTHLVYYANTSNSPFLNHKFSTSSTSKPQSKETISRSFLEEVIRKQYYPTKLMNRTDLSQISSPVCRDVSLPCPSTCLFDTDLCSCCHGQFHDIDKNSHPSQDIFTRLPLTDNSFNTNGYYDSSLYDLVPVKEKPTKIKKEEDIIKKKEAKPYHDGYNIHERCKYNRYQPYLVNYVTSVKNTDKKPTKRKIPIKFTTRRSKSKLDLTSSNIAQSNVDCSEFYVKPTNKNILKRVHKPVIPHTEMKNAECLTTSVNNTECQTSSSKSVQLEPPPPVEDKTEETLNQIKTILQCVLTEVKTSSQIKPTPVEKCLKDAIVQKGASENNVQVCHSLMDNFNYSPYNTIQQCPATFSRQNPYYPPMAGVSGAICPATRCLQNYPLFIQTNGRQCTCCFRNNGARGAGDLKPRPTAPAPCGPACPASRGDSRVPSAVPRSKPLVTSGTNTEGNESNTPTRAKETDTLIKEIYKSLAINMDFPAKGSSTIGYYDGRSSSNSKKGFDFKFVPSNAKNKDTSSEASRGTPDTATTTATTTSVSRTPVVIETQVGSDGTSSSSERSERKVLRSAGIQSYMVKKETRLTSESERERERERVPRLMAARVPGSRLPPRPGAQLSAARLSDIQDTDDSDTDTESDETIVPELKPGKPYIKKKEKSGLFSKMAKFFKSKPKNLGRLSDSESEVEYEIEEEEPSESDSDDYQTVYSQQSKKKHVHYEMDRPKRYRRKPYSKISSSRKNSQRDRQYEKQRRSPYMEQEYRRHWEEDIGFHGGNTPRYSTDQPTTTPREYPPRPQTIPPQYYQAYGANTHVQRQMQFMPTSPNQMPSAPNQMPTAPSQMPTAPNQMPTALNQVPSPPNQMQMIPNQMPTAPNQMPMNPYHMSVNAIEASKPGPSKGPVQFSSGSSDPSNHSNQKSAPKPRGASVSIGSKTPLPRYEPAPYRPSRGKWLKKKCLVSGEQWKKFILES